MTKFRSLLQLVVAAIGIEAIVLDPQHREYNRVNRRQWIPAELYDYLKLGGKVPDPPGALPRRQTLPVKYTLPAATVKKVKMRYGPYEVIGMNKKSVTGERGAMPMYPDTDIEKPCERCIIFNAVADLEYPDGRQANVSTGMWLHHYTGFNIGPGRKDAFCEGLGKTQSGLHKIIGSDAAHSEIFASSGNERTPGLVNALTPPWNTSVGYHIQPADKFAFEVDLMNEKMEAQTVYLTVTYTYAEGYPEGINNIRLVWFDAGGCGITSDIPVPTQNGSFQIDTPRWRPPFEGKILGGGGHLHDGGVQVQMYVDNKPICVANATYGGPGYEDPPNAMEGMKMPNMERNAKKHISKMNECGRPVNKVSVPGVSPLGIEELRKNQTWWASGYYDYNKHLGKLDDEGRQMPVMVIMTFYVEQPRDGRFV